MRFHCQQRSLSSRLLLALCLCLAGASPFCPGRAGDVLDDILNPLRLDAHSGGGPDFSRYVSIRPDAPVGQAFTLGEGAVQLARIGVAVAYWNGNWAEDESLVLTLYDGPQKGARLASFVMPYRWRSWEDAILVFPLGAPVTRGGTYYLELTVEGGDGFLEGIFLSPRAYDGGMAFVGGVPQQEQDLWFEVQAKRPADREANLRALVEAFDLARPELARVRNAVGAGELDRACDELVAHFEGRSDLCPPAAPRPNPDAQWDREAASAAAQMQVPTKDGLVELGPDWNYLATWPTRGGVGLTRSGLRKPLAQAYHATGDERYAIAFNSMMQSFFRNYPSPLKSGLISGQERIGSTFGGGLAGGSLWASLSIGARMLHGFAYYAYFVNSPHFERDTRIAWIASLADMANVLELMNAGGNWETQNATALYEFGLMMPELGKARQWVQAGFDLAVQNLMATTNPDGPLREATSNYHSLCLNRFMSLMEQPNPFGLVLPAEAQRRVEKMAAYTAYSLQPDGEMPAWGDSSFASGLGLVARGAALFGREDLRYIASQGREGREPRKRSLSFPRGGYYVMRSDWSPQAHYLCVHNGHSTAHGHFDALALIAGAYGSLLVLDPGIYIYGTPEADELTQTRAHATVEADGANTVNADGRTRFLSLPQVDYLDGTNAGYQDVEGVRHRRQVLFIRPSSATVTGHPSGPSPAHDRLGPSRRPPQGGIGAWLILDSVTGPGAHRVVQRFPLERGVVEQAATGWVLRAAAGPALHIAPLGAQRAVVLEEGRRSVTWEELAPTPVLAFRYEGELPCTFGELLVPSAPGQDPPVVEDRTAAAKGLLPGDVAAEVRAGEECLLVVLCAEPREGVVLDRLRFSGRACLLRQDAAGRVVGLAGIDLTQAAVDDLPLVSAPGEAVSVDLSLVGDAVRVVTYPRRAPGRFALPDAGSSPEAGPTPPS